MYRNGLNLLMLALNDENESKCYLEFEAEERDIVETSLETKNLLASKNQL